jgi:Sulfotransferase family
VTTTVGTGDAVGALPNVVVIGAMKAGTTAVHRALDAHACVSMSSPKELCFFYDPPSRVAACPPDFDRSNAWSPGNWHRGIEWYAAHFNPEATVRGESSPGYTSPSFAEVAERMASVVPDVRLVYIVRDPVARAMSQYRHHVRDGTERRSLCEAVLDPDSDYVRRSRFFERLEPFIAWFDREQLLVIMQEDLARNPAATMGEVFAHVGLRGGPVPGARSVVGRRHGHVVKAMRELIGDDTAALRRFLRRPLDEWSL